VQNWFASPSASSSSVGLTCVSFKSKLGNLGLSLIVVATGVQNTVAATTTTTTTSPEVFYSKENESQKSKLFFGGFSGFFLFGFDFHFFGFRCFGVVVFADSLLELIHLRGFLVYSWSISD
jgi:hypothetical protein